MTQFKVGLLTHSLAIRIQVHDITFQTWTKLALWVTIDNFNLLVVSLARKCPSRRIRLRTKSPIANEIHQGEYEFQAILPLPKTTRYLPLYVGTEYILHIVYELML